MAAGLRPAFAGFKARLSAVIVLKTEACRHRGATGAALTPGHAGVRPMDRDELVRYSRQIGERREAWREQCAAHLSDLKRAYGR
jgi:hypothetical protein